MFYFFFFFKQKTAYEMRISDWSSDVCSSDLTTERGRYLPSPIFATYRIVAQKTAAIYGADSHLLTMRSSAERAPHGRQSGGEWRTRWDWNTDRKSVVEGTRGSVRVGLGGRRIIKKKKIEM